MQKTLSIFHRNSIAGYYYYTDYIIYVGSVLYFLSKCARFMIDRRDRPCLPLLNRTHISDIHTHARALTRTHCIHTSAHDRLMLIYRHRML